MPSWDPPVLLDVLPVVALLVGQAEPPFLEDRVLAVPQRQAPGSGSRADRRCPRCRPRPTGRRGTGRGRSGKNDQASPLARVVLANRAPLPPGQVGAPVPPRAVHLVRLGQPRPLDLLAHPSSLRHPGLALACTSTSACALRLHYTGWVFWEVKESEWSAEHIARHGVTMDEVREAILERPYWSTPGKNGSVLIYGRTYAGRHLLVAAPEPDGRAFVVTARNMTDREKTVYRSKAR